MISGPLEGMGLVSSRYSSKSAVSLQGITDAEVEILLDWHIDEVLLLALPKKDGWGGLAGGSSTHDALIKKIYVYLWEC